MKREWVPIGHITESTENHEKSRKFPVIFMTFAVILIISTVAYYRQTPGRLIREGMNYQKEHKWHQAVGAYKGALSFHMTSSRALTLLGEEYMLTGDFTRSRFYFEKARACPVVEGRAYYHLGAIMAYYGDADHYSEIMKEVSTKGEERDCRGLLKLLGGAMFPARQEFRLDRRTEMEIQESLDRAGGSLFLKVHRGLIAIYRGRHEEAAKTFKALASAYPDDPYLCAYEGIALLESGHKDEALELLKKAAGLDHENSVAYEYLGSLYLKHNMPDKSLEALEKACELSPRSPGAYYFLGLLYEKQDKVQEAIASIEESLALQPNHGMAHQKLGDLYEKLKLKDRARREYETGFKGALYIAAPSY